MANTNEYGCLGGARQLRKKEKVPPTEKKVEQKIPFYLIVFAVAFPVLLILVICVPFFVVSMVKTAKDRAAKVQAEKEEQQAARKTEQARLETLREAEEKKQNALRQAREQAKFKKKLELAMGLKQLQEQALKELEQDRRDAERKLEQERQDAARKIEQTKQDAAIAMAKAIDKRNLFNFKLRLARANTLVDNTLGGQLFNDVSVEGKTATITVGFQWFVNSFQERQKLAESLATGWTGITGSSDAEIIIISGNGADLGGGKMFNVRLK